MFILGLILFLIGFFFGVGILYTLGIIAMIVGAVMYFAGGVGGRRWY